MTDIDDYDLPSPIIESIRQDAIHFKQAEEYWKTHCPKGKEYVGYRFVAFSEKSKGTWGWTNLGWKVKPVYRKVKS